MVLKQMKNMYCKLNLPKCYKTLLNLKMLCCFLFVSFEGEENKCNIQFETYNEYVHKMLQKGMKYLLV